MNNFLITSQGRTGTMFLSRLMNRSRAWKVRHQPNNKDAILEGKVNALPQPAFPWMQRFNCNYYGEVNGLLRYYLPNIDVVKRGIIYRPLKHIIDSFYNGSKHDDIIPKIHDIHICHNAFYGWCIADPSIVLINFDRMVNDIEYSRRVLYKFGILDVRINERLLGKKVNPSGRARKLPKEACALLEQLQFADYNELDNWLT